VPRTFTDNQIQAIGTDGCDICVAAGAGSGKTGVLVERFIRLVTQSRTGVLPPEQRAGVDQILVITFTEKATKEMKTRIVEELTRLGLTDERRQVESAYISTIHGFCSRLLQENPFEVGIDPHFTVLEEAHARRLLRQTVESVIADAYSANDNETMELVAGVQSLRRHGEEQADPVASVAEAVESLLGKLRSAGRSREELDRHVQGGSGLTSACSEELVWSVLTPVLEEVRECARELEGIYSGLLGSARTTCDVLLQCARRARGGGTPSEALAAMRELFQLLRKHGRRGAGVSPAETQLVQYAGRLKSSIDSHAALLEADLPDRAEAALHCHRMLALTAAIWAAYDDVKRRQGAVDNDDLQAECVRLLEDVPEVRERYQRRLRYLMVDEFQDTNPLQMRLVDLLHVPQPTQGDREGPASNDRQGPPGRNYLFVVGDVQQSIYGFRGAEPTLFRGLERRYREEGAGLHVPLAKNFRSRPDILKLVAHLFGQVWRGAETPFVPLEAGLAFDTAGAPGVEILLSQDLMRQDYLTLEPTALARRVRQLVEGEELRITSHADPRRGEPVRYRDIAVLLRQLTDIQKYEEAFSRAGVPFFVVGGGRGYYARQEIRDLLNILTVLETPLNDIALLAALRSPIVGADIDTLYHIVEVSKGGNLTNVGAKLALAAAPVTDDCKIAPDRASDARAGGPTPPGAKRQAMPLYIALQQVIKARSLPVEEAEKVELFVGVMDSLRAQEDRMPVGHLLERLISSTSYDARLLCRPNGRRRLANVRKLLQMAHADPVFGVRDFIRRLRDLERLSDREGDAPTEEEAADVVRFHTIHGAKGLEFPVVILADMSRSLEHPERGLFVCEPHRLALGTRVCGLPDAVYRAVDHLRRVADREESERLLYVAMTRARERLILCGNLGRGRGSNWSDQLFPALGINEAPAEPLVQALIGGIEARVAPLSYYVHLSEADDAPTANEVRELARFSDRLAEALLNGEPIEAVQA
jgi:ATP-dependent helicase/nuclease subunit A